ncbi:uncharacterized protein CANTADRAFT_6663 [Suhomyces tanzawaensis NRRL Y-17324]|uniref:Large ribosomal subunit protein mL50 n=1 Tax=Suhomyces tanzawaensis NRRL Y-17324 TaxID=984487 RepID=A0A1E4SFF7_9ASCO|nr:uncharacterized protein CANTADRAFT_6663 [Suhomyces tanzawaensis NRRL Y-17324]ODV78259.1 hypothetical protein CANTADRAFT_6663 [Suhomyces tanzawaensis NRRL Y-17324]
MIAPLRRAALRPTIRISSIRSFGYSQNRPFLNLFGKKDLKKREEIIKNQDDFESDPESKIVILSKENSPDYKPFDAETDMPDFKVNQWKSIKVLQPEIETTYNSEKLIENINQAYLELKGQQISVSQYNNIDLHDLSFRFEFAKALQKKLGFDFNDYTLTTSHTLSQLQKALDKQIKTRWVSERNPNGIVLRKEDFKAPNIYLSEELNEQEQQQKLKDLVEEARQASA